MYEKVFLNYTRKQWDLEPEELMGVTDRVPILISRDDRYFQDKYQVMPKEGYTKMFERMLSSKNIKIMLNTDYKEIVKIDFDEGKVYLFNNEFKGIFIYTGEIDYFFNYKYGKLPYRSLRFKFIELDKKFYLDTATENFPNEYEFTRITEFKHFYKSVNDGNINKTIIVEEYPEKYNEENEPYYPIPKKEYLEIYEKYKKEVSNLNNKFRNIKFYFVGRLAEYRYYNMDKVVERALEVFEEIKEGEKK
ncbi:UDP-galactopyranose mutase [Methanocaldococcus infernus ME]|uniref:UDP-galactopyranose mutase n=1 Tax=Methanocaldococcus infernus (strain DSM 11812 / JCM 15783 / ME) TaxID=573063 RepID=D5VQN9_METIM